MSKLFPKDIWTIAELEKFAEANPFNTIAVFERYPYKWAHHSGMTVHMLEAADAVVWAREHGFEYASPSPDCMGGFDNWMEALYEYSGCQTVFLHHGYEELEWWEVDEMQREHRDCRFVYDNEDGMICVSYGIDGSISKERAKEVIYEVLDTAAIEVLDEYGNNVRDEEGLPMYVE